MVNSFLIYKNCIVMENYGTYGIQLIAKEREEQITKHGFTADFETNQQQLYIRQQHLHAASAVLRDNINLWPPDWDVSTYEKISKKPHKDRVVIVAALIAAWLDFEEHNNIFIPGNFVKSTDGYLYVIVTDTSSANDTEHFNGVLIHVTIPQSEEEYVGKNTTRWLKDSFKKSDLTLSQFMARLRDGLPCTNEPTVIRRKKSNPRTDFDDWEAALK